MLTASFLIFLALFLGVGIASARRSRGTTDDYLLAGKSVGPSLVGLSAIATNNSGFMFIAMIGITYADGLDSIWLMVGWILGDLAASLVAVRPLRQAGEHASVQSFGGLLGRWQGRDDRLLQLVTGVCTIFFLTLYASGQLKAGSKATSVLLDWPAWAGIVSGAVVVLIYSASGGIRASIWTDVAQSVVMIFGMVALTVLGLTHLGGVTYVADALRALPDDYLSPFPERGTWGIALFIIGWLFGGIAVIGQPHIISRYLCLDSAESIPRMRFYYYGWFTLFYTATILVGMLSRLVFPDATAFDQELALPKMAQQFLPGVFGGLILAALFAAAMSTADSIILSCSAALTHDVFRGRRRLGFAKAMTASVLSAAALIALFGAESVFKLVLDAWGLLGSAFAPLVLFLATGHRCSQTHALAAAALGVAVFLAVSWMPLGTQVYAVAPGILVGLTYLSVARRPGRSGVARRLH